MAVTSPRSQVQDQITYQNNRYENQQGPLANAIANNYGRFSESDYGNYTDIMNQYRDIASGGGSSGGGGGGGGYTPPSYSAFKVSPGSAGYKDPFESYSGYKEFSKTGGYSDQDVSNMRARSVAPIRAAYSNAQQEVGRNRSLQGGYSPNAIAAQVKMAREQGQSGADAMTNVEAALAQMRQQGRLAGLGGMSNIEGQRLSADVDVSKYNTGLDFQGQTYNAGADERAQTANNQAAERAAASAASARAQGNQDRLAALNGMRGLYGTTPGASQLFGDQAISITGQGANQGSNMINAFNNANRLPDAWDQTNNRINDVMDYVNAGTNIVGAFQNRGGQQQQQQPPNNRGGGSSYYAPPAQPTYNNDNYGGTYDPNGSDYDYFNPNPGDPNRYWN